MVVAALLCQKQSEYGQTCCAIQWESDPTIMMSSEIANKREGRREMCFPKWRENQPSETGLGV